MSKLTPFYLVLSFCFIVFLSSCDSEEDSFNGLFPSETNKVYTNKMASMSVDNQLELIYSGNAFLGKSVYFEIKNSNLAHMTLVQVLPGEEETPVEIISLTEIKGGGYIFEGQNTSATGISFSYSGSITNNKLSLVLAEITLPANALSSEDKWYNTKTTLNWQLTGTNLAWSLFSPLLSNFLDNILLSVLHDVTFHPDGNITAGYAALPEEAEIGNMFIGSNNYNDRNPEDWNTSPLNVATYYLKDNKLFVIPQVEMLMYRLLSINGTKAETGEILDFILNLLGGIGQWTTQGIGFTITENNTSVSLTLEKDQIEFLFPLLPYLGGIIPADILPAGIGDLLDDLLQEAALNTSEFNLTITLSK